MRFLAYESCDFAIVHALRANGYDVLAVSEITPRAEDSDVIRLAVREKRILLTEDKDFGRLVYSHGQKRWESFSFGSQLLSENKLQKTLSNW